MQKEKIFSSKKDVIKFLGAIVGSFLFAAGVIIFIVPIHLYNGGIVGISQVIRTILVEHLNLPLERFDIAGLIYYIVNIPLFFIAYKNMGKGFFYKTLINVSAMTLFMTIIPIPKGPILVNDILGSCLIGGIVTGCGTGLVLAMGSSQGGMDILGLYFLKKAGSSSMGKINLVVNLSLYAICLLLFDIPTVIYSIIFATIASIMIDKVHVQNINVEVKIITKLGMGDIQKDIFKELGRGVTQWKVTGGYTGEESNMLYVALSKYEVNHLKRIVHRYSPNAFIVINEKTSVYGNYLKKL